MNADDILKFATPMAVIVAAIIQKIGADRSDRKLSVVHDLARRVADLTGKPEDAAVADEAIRVLKEHDKKQAVVDAKPDAFKAT